MPEQHHPLDQRLLGNEHLVDPPELQITPLVLARLNDRLPAFRAGLALLGGKVRLSLARLLGRIVDPRGRWRRCPGPAAA